MPLFRAADQSNGPSRDADIELDAEAGRKRGPDEAAGDLEGKARKVAREAIPEAPVGGRRLRVKLTGAGNCTRQMQAHTP